MLDQITGKLNRKSLVHQIADAVENLVISGNLKPGERLPSERSLSESFKVSRSVIREATRILNERNLVEVRPGSGVYIRQPGTEKASASISLFMKLKEDRQRFQDFCEVRESLEVEVAGFAAQRATPENIEALQEAYHGMITHKNHGSAFVEYDLQFHTELATATQNALYLVLMKALHEIQLSFRLNSYRMNTEAALAGGIRCHQKIMNAVVAGNVAKARSEMKMHLYEARQLMESALEDIDR